ncbi:MAG: FAD-binding dehydrogenase [Rhodospirillaceae bacterium]|nr:FAD-binding dehydrogenase [Rhodospirillaceae bacterium]
MCGSKTPSQYVDNFDEEYDVVVVGFGYAGGAAAIAAHDGGAKTLLIEKMPMPGGISICAGGGVRLAVDRDPVVEHLWETNDGTTPRAIIESFVDEMMLLDDYLEELCKVNDATTITIEGRGANYPFTGFDQMKFVEVDNIPGVDVLKEYPHARSHRNGTKLFKVVDDNVKTRGIEVRFSTPARRLITQNTNEVRGLWVDGPDGLKSIKATKGVILACGGFEAAPEMQRQFWQIYPVLSAAHQGNTGDGIKMATDVGADLWHMWHYHGTYGFRHPDPDYPFGMRMKRHPDWVPTKKEADIPMAWILADKHGRRFMNEYQPYTQDTGHRALDFYDTSKMEFPYVPCFMIADENGRERYQFGATIYNDSTIDPYEWSKDNLKEVQNGILKKADTIKELAELIGCEFTTLENTINDYNASVDSGAEDPLGRPPKTRLKIKRPPFYLGEIWPVVSNTQGGPRHNEKYQICNAFNQPIPRLYAAGECGGIWGFLYLAGANLTECFVGGRVSGREASAMSDWDS